MTGLSKVEYQRYSRHIIIPDIGVEGQLKIKAAKVLVVGAGGLGVPVLLYLAAAGVGQLGIVDFDHIDRSNLQRQVMYKDTEIGELKAEKAKIFINQQNPDINVKIYTDIISSENAFHIIGEYDLVIDGTDNFPTRYLLNDACVLLGKPYIYGSIFRFEGQVSVFNFQGSDGLSPNYRDLFPEPPDPDLVPNCSEGGVLGVLPGIVGSLQALEAIKLITGIGELLTGKLLTIDTLSNQYRSFKFKRRPDNPLNGEHPSISQLIDYEKFCNPASLENKKAISEINVEKLATWKTTGKVFQLIDVREAYEVEIAEIGGDLMPKSEIESHIYKISKIGPVVVYCRSGKRSGDVIRLLQENYGYDNLLNLSGGILAYAEKIDSTLNRY